MEQQPTQPQADSEAEKRWSLGGYARQYPWPQCRYCGRAQNHDCERVECMLCGSPQCKDRADCRVCHHGYLPGWSRMGRTECGYSKCTEPAIAYARKRPVCASHAKRIKVAGGVTLTEHVARQIAHRDSGKGWEHWRLVA